MRRSSTADRLVLHTTYTPDETGRILLGFAGANHGRLFVDGVLVVDDKPVIEGTDLGAAFLNPPSLTAAIQATAGEPIDIRAEFTLAGVDSPLVGVLSATLGIAPDDSDPEGLIAAAAAAAAASDIAVVVVGTNSKVESEGYDRENLDLPGRQDDLVRAVAAANPRTIVIVNAGLARRAAVGGRRRGDRARLLRRPGVRHRDGRHPHRRERARRAPAHDLAGDARRRAGHRCDPHRRTLTYDEGIHIGYRAWLKRRHRTRVRLRPRPGLHAWSWDSARGG